MLLFYKLGFMSEMWQAYRGDQGFAREDYAGDARMSNELSDTERKILEHFKIPSFLIDYIDELIYDAWHDGCDRCQDDYYVGD